ncbi:hypothetical protein [Vibrio harveyi]|uniref:hypothetical protein n=1 Tax=Vibrio harveyi TaxID=669 RepID=UPI00165D4B0F|nr:hypothetical protein [Vibrio harveyi]
MKLPIFLSSALVVLGVVFGGWLICQDLTLNEKLTLIVYIATAVGGLVSAIFIVYGYFVNLSVFKESQKPKLLIQVHNGSCFIDVNSIQQEVHQTIIRYANLSDNECRSLSITATLETEGEKIIIPRLFSETMNLSPGDDRCRDFLTLKYLADNGVAQAVLDNLYRYKLKVSYSYTLMGESTSSDYYYSWNAQAHSWQIV